MELFVMLQQSYIRLCSCYNTPKVFLDVAAVLDPPVAAVLDKFMLLQIFDFTSLKYTVDQ